MRLDDDGRLVVWAFSLWFMIAEYDDDDDDDGDSDFDPMTITIATRMNMVVSNFGKYHCELYLDTPT